MQRHYNTKLQPLICTESLNIFAIECFTSKLECTTFGKLRVSRGEESHKSVEGTELLGDGFAIGVGKFAVRGESGSHNKRSG